MFHLSLTACSFYFKKTNSKGNTKIFCLNEPINVTGNDGIEYSMQDLSALFTTFFKKHHALLKDDTKQQSFMCEYEEANSIEADGFKMIYVKISSGIYGSASDIIDGSTEKIKYKKKSTDIDTRPFYLMVIFPKDNEQVKVQKGMLIFQNVGQFGIKTITTKLMQDFFSKEFKITLQCKTISPDLFIKKVIRQDNIKKLIMVKNIKSNDLSDNIGKGYGSEVREIGNLRFSQNLWAKMMDKIRYVAGGRYNLFEFESIEYDSLKVVVDIGGRTRKIDLHNLENLSIIEGIPDEIKMADGHPNLALLIEYFKKVATEYLEDLVLQIT